MFRIPYQIILILRPIVSIVFTINSASKREKKIRQTGINAEGVYIPMMCDDRQQFRE